MMRVPGYSFNEHSFDKKDVCKSAISAVTNILVHVDGTADDKKRYLLALHYLYLAAENKETEKTIENHANSIGAGKILEHHNYLGLNGETSGIFDMTTNHMMSSTYGKSIKKYQNAKVLLVGHWKSGTIWLHQLLSDSLDLEIIIPGLGTPDKFFSRGIVKTHGLLSPYIKSRGDLLHGVYILRDIRDVIVSMYHFTKTDYYTNAFGSAASSYSSIESFYYDFFLSWFVPQYDWKNHPRQYIEAGMPYIKYEDLYDDPLSELNRLFRRWGIIVDSDKIRRAIEKNQLERLKKAQDHSRSGVSASHFRKGGYGNYKEELPLRVIKDINKRFEDFLLRWGYDV